MRPAIKARQGNSQYANTADIPRRLTSGLPVSGCALAAAGQEDAPSLVSYVTEELGKFRSPTIELLYNELPTKADETICVNWLSQRSEHFLLVMGFYAA